MLVVYDLTIPPNTPMENPLSAVIKPTVGYLTGVEVYFRDGCLDAVGVRLFDNGRQIAPFPSGWLRDNNRHISWSENRQLEGPPYVLIVEGYSIALDWPHTITFKFMMVL